MLSSGAMAGSGPERRHPAEVTADRLLHAYERWSDRLTGAEGLAIGTVCRALTRIAQADQEAGQ